jgi:hypothetical protein
MSWTASVKQCALYRIGEDDTGRAVVTQPNVAM